MTIIKRPAKERCVNCHFFVINDPSSGLPRMVDKAKRRAIREGDIGENMSDELYACKYGVWDFRSVPDKKERPELLRASRDKERKNCFFWPYTPDMLFPAAGILQERAAKERDARKDRVLTIIGLWIAAIALVIQLILEILK